MAMAVDMKVLCHPSQSHWYPWEKDKQVIMMAGVVHLWCTLLCHWRLSYHTQLSAWVLRVSALHYSAGDWVSGGFRTVASARALCQPTSCGSEYFYNQCPQVRNLIRTERSLNRSERRLRGKQAKSNLNWQNSEYRGISNSPGFWIMKADYFRYMEIESLRYSQWVGIGLRESDGCRKWPEVE